MYNSKSVTDCCLIVDVALLKDRLWRKTRSKHPDPRVKCRGVDPNRNWDFHWGGEEEPVTIEYPSALIRNWNFHSERTRLSTFLTEHSLLFLVF